MITVVFYDSRIDAAYAPSLPPGDTAAGENSDGAVNTLIARSANGGATWSEQGGEHGRQQLQLGDTRLST